MDGMKLDEAYRQKNGLGPAAPGPKVASKKEPEYERFDAADVKSDTPPVVEEIENEPASQPETSATAGFIDKVLQEKDAPKAKKAKPPKPPKEPKAPKPKLTPKPAPKPKPVKKPKATLPPAKPVVTKAAPAAKPAPARKVRPIASKNPSSQLISIGKVVVFVAVAVFCVYNFIEVQRLNDLLNTETGQQSQNEAKNKELINTISAFRLLPDSEYEVYTVKDKSKLVNDPVFEYAENGDKVVVYPSSSLTIVYRESDGRIVGESKSSSLTEK